MTTFDTIPEKHRESLAAGHVDTADGVLLSYESGVCVVAKTGSSMYATTADRLTISSTTHNTNALAIVLARASGEDVSSGVIAVARGRSTVERLVLVTLSDGLTTHREFAAHRDVPALANIPTTDPGALFRALVAALCALETP